ncbi:MAG: hypothetical protein JW775_04430 [Candidatus Aminicenantes bacterium]|nr:hypothetical protein [Candidatus Aminicenantes bacterium]
MRHHLGYPLVPKLIAGFLAVACLGGVSACGRAPSSAEEPLVVTTFVEFPDEFLRLEVMVDSLRTFGGRLKNAPVWAYVAEELLGSPSGSLDTAKRLGAEVRSIYAPENVTWFPLVRKVFAAAHAEAQASGRASVLARLDPDTIFIDEPAEYLLPEGKSLGWRPVFHRNIGSLFDEPLDAYWSRAYEVMGIRDEAVFPMITPADGHRIRPYFQAGCVVVRPERGLLKKWEETLVRLAADPLIRDLCGKDQSKRTFTFQAALTGAVLNHLERGEMTALSDRINYPLFFREMFGGGKDFHDMTSVATVRYEYFFQNAPPDWDKTIRGPADRIAWIKDRFGSEGQDPDHLGRR